MLRTYTYICKNATRDNRGAKRWWDNMTTLSPNVTQLDGHLAVFLTSDTATDGVGAAADNNYYCVHFVE